jgi:hypothetical protein
MRFVRIFAFLALIVVFGYSCAEIQGAQQTQQQQNNKKKKKTTKKGQVLPPMNNVPATPLPAGRVLANGTTGLPGVNTVDKEADFVIADDATIQQLTKFPDGLKFVAADSDDLKEGLLVTLTLKGDKIENVSGTITKLADSNTKVTLRLTIASGQTAPEQAGRPCTQVSIRTSVEANAK